VKILGIIEDESDSEGQRKRRGKTKKDHLQCGMQAYPIKAGVLGFTVVGQNIQANAGDGQHGDIV
jgi:hypothetical protein